MPVSVEVLVNPLNISNETSQDEIYSSYHEASEHNRSEKQEYQEHEEIKE